MRWLTESGGIVDVWRREKPEFSGYQESLFARPPDDDRGALVPVRTTPAASGI